MNCSHRISGIYDYRTIQFLQELKINHFSFDLRPRSLNFIQEYRLIEILEKMQLGNIYLRFENEQSYIIERIYNNCLKAFGGRVLLELSGNIDIGFIKENKFPFLFVVNEKDLELIPVDELCVGHTFSYEFLQMMHLRGEFVAWVSAYYRKFNASSLNNIQILDIDWDSDIFPSLYEYFDFDLRNLPINGKIEVCYRNVDLNKISTNLKTI